jgi:hypothetical protein
MVIPDTQAHLNGHAVITYTHSVFADNQDGRPYPEISKEAGLHLKENPDPGYYGFITFENPGSMFSYTADGLRELTAEEVNELIEHLSHERDNGGWKKE